MNKNEYKDIAKSNFVYGGVKIIQVLVLIFKTKIVAVLLGPSGVGILSLLNTTVTTIFQFTNLGISQSSVRDISIESDSEEKKKIAKTVNYLAIFLGIISSILCFIFSQVISNLVFGKLDYSFAFKIVAVSLFFQSVSSAQVSILQGLRMVVVLSKASLIGAIASLLLSIPLFYFWKIESIPYAIVLGYFITSLIYYIYRKKKYSLSILIDNVSFKTRTKSIIGLGVTLMVGNGIMAVFNLGLNTFINRFGSEVEVGYYQAASMCSYSAINILISILASDYYPRMASVIEDSKKSTEVLNAQIALLLLVLSPVVCFMIVFPTFFIHLLYSSEFILISGAVQIMSISLFFRIIWHCFSYIILAKGDKKMYLYIDAILGNGLFFIGNIIGFYFMKVDGIAISFVVISCLVMTILYILVSFKYHIKLEVFTIKLASFLFIICLVIYLFNILFDESLFKLYTNIFVSCIVFVFCCKQIDEKTGIFSVIAQKIKLWKKE